MGKAIDLNKPLSDEDKEWLETRSMREDIELNERRFGEDGSGPDEKAKPADDGEVEVSEKVYDEVMSLSEPELDTKLQHYGMQPTGDLRSKRTALAVQLQEDEDAREKDRSDTPEAKQAEVDKDPTK